MNSICVVGRIVRPIEVNTKGKTTYCRNALAVKRMYNKNETDFFNIIAFGKTVEIMEEYLDKGSQVAVEGRMESTSKDGKVFWDLIVSNITLLDGVNKKQSRDDYDDEDEDENEDDFPF